MRLELRLPDPEVVYGQPMPLCLTFVNDGAERDFPTTPSAGRLLRVVLLDGEAQVLGEASGEELQARRGLEVAAVDPLQLTTMRFPAGERMEHREDLLAYFGPLPVGDYGVRVCFELPTQSLALESGPLRFCVRPLVAAGFDLLVDEVVLRTVHVASAHRAPQGQTTLVHVRPARAPEGQWGGVAIPDTPPVPAVLSVAGFRTRASFEHDFSRWLLWLYDGVVSLAFVDEHRLGARSRWELPVVQAQLLGRPVQHEDRSLSIGLLATERGAASTDVVVHRHRVDAQGQPLDHHRYALPRALARPRVYGSACDHDGRISVLVADDGVPPLLRLTLDADADAELRERVVLGAETMPSTRAPGRLLAADLQAKGEPARVYAAGIVNGDEPEPGRLWWGWAPNTDREPAPWQIHQCALEGLKLEPDDRLVTGAFASDLGGRVHCVFGSARGAVHYTRDGGAPRPVDLGLRTRPGHLALVHVHREVWLAFEAETTGVGLRRLA